MKNIVTASLFFLVMCSPLATLAVTSTTHQSQMHRPTLDEPQVKQFVKVAEQGLDAIRNIQRARVALFQGDPRALSY